MTYNGGIMSARINRTEKETTVLIKEVALELFAQYGYQATSMRMIAKKAGITAGSITFYFGSKANLYKEIYEEVIEIAHRKFMVIEEEMDRLNAEGKMTKETAWNLIEKMVDMQIDFVTEPQNRTTLLMYNIQTMEDEETKEVFEKGISTVRKIEGILTDLIIFASEGCRYLQARVVANAAYGSLVSIGEHAPLLLDEVISGAHSPQSIQWTKEYLKNYIMAGIKSVTQKKE